VDDRELLIDLHLTADRQGPGGAAETRRAIELSGLSKQRGLKVADVGCGTGASTLVLAGGLDAQIIAVDLLPEFLDVLRSRAAQAGLAGRIRTTNATMESLPFAAGSLDAIWSEGAIYNMGFENGVRQ
jgi:ubiquinone/menaquinone biosynthesis C-methylase UbiE